jgi:putative transposase
VDVPPNPLPPTGHEAGVDLGLKSFAVTSDGEVFDNPQVMRRAENSVASAQRRVSKKKRGGRNRRKAARLLSKRHRHLKNVRREHHIHVARALVAGYDFIAVEALNIKGLARGMLSKSVHDAGWGNFLGWLRTKAEEAGRVVVEVNPAGTSQTCSACGETVRKSLAVRVHRCPCGLVMDRDENAALNILAAGRAVRRGALRSQGTPTTCEVQVETTRSVHTSRGLGVNQDAARPKTNTGANVRG